MSSDEDKTRPRRRREDVVSAPRRFGRSPFARLRWPGPGNYGRTLVGRLLVALLATAALIYVAAVAGLWWTGGGLIEDSARKQAVQWLGELDEIGTPLYASSGGDEAVRQALAARLADFPQIAYVRYYDGSGARLLGGYGQGEAAAPLSEDLLKPGPAAAGKRPYRLTPLGSARVRVTAPLQVRAVAPDALLALERAPARESVRVIGYLDFVFDAGEERVQFQRSLVGGSLALALVLCVAVVYGRYKVQRAMAPLTALEEPLARLARGDTNVEIGGGGDREIAAIREALNGTVAALKQRDEALRRAESDAVTGLVNQRYFEQELALECGRLERAGASGAVLCIDVDHFKDVNDGVGTAAGDRLLGQVAGLLRARIRENDLLARLDGDEFAALVRGVNPDGAVKVARSINQVLQEFHFAAGERVFPINVSIGIAVLSAASSVPQAVLAQAQAACAEAKARGGSRYYLGAHGEAGAARDTPSSAWSHHVRTAIQDNALRFVYQPIVGLHGTDREERYELLLRLAGPGGQPVSPAAFLPVADRLGLTGELDRWAVRSACEELARLQARGRRPTFFVNLSGHAFEDGESLVRTVSAQLARCGLGGERLVFEVTEQAAVRQLRQARVAMERLRTLGCRFALDDFGSGFSSLNYLKHLPVAFIKISGTFVQHLGADAVDNVMVQSIVQLGRALRMQTVAESVEDWEALQRVIDLGVDFAQGHVLARPAEDLADRALFALNRPPRRAVPRTARPSSGLGIRPSLGERR